MFLSDDIMQCSPSSENIYVETLDILDAILSYVIGRIPIELPRKNNAGPINSSI
jgi:hypothetical protein